MPRVLHVTQPTDGGAASVVRNLLADQMSRGWPTGVACPEGPLGDAARGAGVHVFGWESRRSPTQGVIGESRRLARILDEYQPDLVHLHSSKAGLVGRLIIRNEVPTIFQPHGWSFNTVGTNVKLAALWEKYSAHWTSRLICVSRKELADGRARGVKTAASIIPNGVDINRFVPGDRAGARKVLGIEDSVPLAVCLGRVAAEKGQDQLLLAWQIVSQKFPAAELWIVGDGPDKPEWRERPEGQHPSIKWMAGTDCPESYLTAADVVVLPSRTEGMALVPLEAMACGRSVVAFDVGGTRDSMGTSTGALVYPGDLRSMALELHHRLQDRDLADAEGVRGRQRVEREFTHELSARCTAEVALDLLGQAHL